MITLDDEFVGYNSKDDEYRVDSKGESVDELIKNTKVVLMWPGGVCCETAGGFADMPEDIQDDTIEIFKEKLKHMNPEQIQ